MKVGEDADNGPHSGPYHWNHSCSLEGCRPDRHHRRHSGLAAWPRTSAEHRDRAHGVGRPDPGRQRCRSRLRSRHRPTSRSRQSRTDYLDLSTGGCKPKAAVSGLVDISGTVTGPVLKVSDPTLKGGTHGKAYSATIGVSGGKKPYAFAAVTALPAGLSLNKKTGAITGKPAKKGSYTFTLTVTDSTKPTHNILTVLIQVTIS
jgi:hypothetical protein